MILHRVPHPFSHCDGEVAEFPVVAGEELDGKGLSQWRGLSAFIRNGAQNAWGGLGTWGCTPLVGQDVFENGRAFRFRETLGQQVGEIKAASLSASNTKGRLSVQD